MRGRGPEVQASLCLSESVNPPGTATDLLAASGGEEERNLRTRISRKSRHCSLLERGVHRRGW